jgi:hypothetical protein
MTILRHLGIFGLLLLGSNLLGALFVFALRALGL